VCKKCSMIRCCAPEEGPVLTDAGAQSLLTDKQEKSEVFVPHVALEGAVPQNILSPASTLSNANGNGHHNNSGLKEKRSDLALGGEDAKVTHQALTGYQQRQLDKNELEVAARIEKRNAVEGGHAGHSHGKPVFWLTAVISSLINFLLMFGLCCAYGMIMFSDDFHKQHGALGVKMNLSTALIMGCLVACCSKVNVAIGGPDLNPVVFFATFVQKIGESVAGQLELQYPTSSPARRLWETDNVQDFVRHLAGDDSSTVEFCTGTHLADNLSACEEYHAQLRATVLFSAFASSALFAAIFFLLGKAQLTKYVSYVPTSVQEAFLSCIGYKVFKYALKFSNYDYYQFVPAACVGVPLYFMKAMHIGNPAIVMPLGILLPLAIFWAIVLGAGYDVDADTSDFFFPKMSNEPFYLVWTDSIGQYSKINFTAWVSTFTDLGIMILVVVLDCSLKISSTENKIPVKVDKNYEISLYGAVNAIVSVFASTVGYMQLKFNVINYGVMGNVVDRRAGIIYSLLCGAAFFSSIEFFNYLPRLFLSALLFFAGTGFVCENLWGSRQYLVFIEWLEILLILGVFIITGQLLPAVIVGILVAAMSFLVKYSKVSAILGAPMRGSQVRLQHRVGEAAVHTLRQVQDSWLLAIRLKGFIFFGSVQGVTSMVATRIETEKSQKVPNYRRLQIVIFDCAQLDGIEVSAAKSLTKLSQESKSAGVQIIFSSVSKDLAQEMKSRGVIHGDHDLFPDMEAAIFYVEDLALQYAKAMEGLFSSLHPAIQYHQAARKEQVTFEPFGGILVTDDARLGCPWRFCTKVDIKKHSTLLWSPKEKHDVLYLIHTGSVGIFESIPEDRRHWKSPVAVYGHGQFLNLEMLAGRTPKGNAVCIESGQVIAWDRDQWRRMSRHEPVMAAKLLEAAMAQRQNESGSAENEELSSSICGEVSEQVMRLLAAKALKELGFFEPLPPGVPSSLPLLPERLKHDCRVAFRTFRRYTDDGLEVIDPYDVKSALMYAGIFGAQLSHERLFPLSEAQFVHVANEAYMTRFSARQIALAEDLFGKFDADGSGALELDELHMVIQEMTGVDEVHDSQIDGLAAAWKGSCRVDQSGQLVIDRQTFLSIMSRYVKAHMNDYMLLQGLLEMTKTKPEELMSSKLTLETLADALNTSGENAEVRVYRHAVAKLRSASLRQSMEDSAHESVMDVVQEIVWAHKPLARAGGDSNLSSLDFTDLVAAALPTELRPKAGATLPPKPPKKAARSSHKEQVPAEDLHVLQSLVLDLREPKAQKTVFELGRRTAQRRISERIEDVQLDDGGERSISVQKLTSDEPAELTDVDRMKIRVFNFLERPKSSMAALAWFYADCILVILCVVSLVAEPLVLVVYPDDPGVVTLIKFVEWFFTILFTVELLTRWAVCTVDKSLTYTTFWKQPGRIADLIAILPSYLELFININSSEFRLMRVARLSRLARLQRFCQQAAPIAMVLVVIWGIYLQH